MKYYLFALCALFVASCKSSDKKKLEGEWKLSKLVDVRSGEVAPPMYVDGTTLSIPNGEEFVLSVKNEFQSISDSGTWTLKDKKLEMIKKDQKDTSIFYVETLNEDSLTWLWANTDSLRFFFVKVAAE